MGNHTADFDWEFIFHSIESKKTVLFIGPSIATNSKGMSMQSDFFEKLFAEHPNDIISYHHQDGFLIFKDEGSKERLMYLIEDYYAQNFAYDIIEKIVKTPFHLIIMVSPDMTVKRVFEQQHFKFEYNYFDKNKLREIKNTPSKENPLIYGLVGSIDDTETLILSHQDLFNYLKALFEEKTVPINLKQFLNINVVNNLIFIGMDFDKWYFQLLINLLDLNQEKFSRYALQCTLSEYNKPLFLNDKHYKITFVDKNIPEFVNEIYLHFESKDKLRKPMLEEEKPREYITANIRKLLFEAFSDDNLNVLCQDYFKEVYNNLTDGMEKSRKINILIDYVEKSSLHEDLLKHAKEINSIGYEYYKPYFK